MIGIVEYGAGNTGNVRRALKHLGYASTLCQSPENAEECDILILPGVGAFPPAMARLNGQGWTPFLREWAFFRRPLLGICLGMQLLCEASLENTETKGLGLIDGTVELLEGTRRLPHMGWNRINWLQEDHPLTRTCSEGTHLYFVHSYALRKSVDALAITEIDGHSFVSAVHRDGIVGLQFHPERSGLRGLSLLGGIMELMGAMK